MATGLASPLSSSRASPPASSVKRAPQRTRPHALEKLVRSDGTIDWSPWYLTDEEDMGQGGEQGRIIQVLHSSLQVLAEERGWSTVLVASDNFFAWVEGEPHVQVSPDVYLLDYPALSPGSSDETPAQNPSSSSSSMTSRMLDQPLPTRWEPWRPEHAPPRLAIEIVSADWRKDYDINPPRYDHLGVSELVLVDPDAFLRDLSAAGRAPLSIYRRTGEDRLELAYRGPGPAPCAEIDAYLRFQPTSTGAARVRISRDAAGTEIVPTTWEQAAAAEQRAAAAEEKVRAQAAEIAALRARLRGLDEP